MQLVIFFFFTKKIKKNILNFSRNKLIGKYLCSGFCLGSILLEWSHKSHFVLGRLEATMTHLGAGVDKLQFDVLQSLPLGVDKEGLSQSQNTFFRSNTTSLNHDKVLFNQTIMRKSSHGIDPM